MTRKEFEQRTNQTVSLEDYERIESIYMNTVMDKDAFCKDYMKHSDSAIIADLQRTIVKLENLIQVREINRIQTADLCHDIARQLIGASVNYNDLTFRAQAVRLIGEKEVVKLKLQMGGALCDDDVKYLMDKIDKE